MENEMDGPSVVKSPLWVSYISCIRLAVVWFSLRWKNGGLDVERVTHS